MTGRMRMDMRIIRRKISILAFLMIIAMSLTGCMEEDDVSKVSKEWGLDLKDAESVTVIEETHGGFHGDGDTVIKVEFSDDSFSDQANEDENWNPLPLNKTLHTLIYEVCSNTLSLPDIKNGYYSFTDRYDGAENHNAGPELLERYSYNFDFGIYDSDTRTLYLCKCDS